MIKQIRTTFGKLNSDGTKAVYFTNDKKEKIFGFWFDPKNDNPHDLKPNQAVFTMIRNAGYHDLADFFETNKHKTVK